jgi:hypothetical protein
MQEFSGISDEVIIDCLRLATNFGIFGKQAEDTVRSAHALSLGLGMDLNSAMMLLVRASEGHTETLARYGLSIEKTGDKAKDFATLIKTVDDKFGSLAGANVDNAITKTNALKESFNDLMEVVGQKLTPLFNFIAKRLKDTFDGINILIGMSKEESDYLRLLRNEENLLKDIERAKSQGTTDFLPMWEKQLASIKEQLEVHRAINREENARKTLMGELAKKQELEAVKVKEAAELRVEQEKALTEKLNKELEDVNKKSLNVMASQVNDYLQQRANDEKLYGDKRIQFYKDEVQRLTQ